ncbi:unnamed protein product [Oikopleura dioica]|uniref:Uncharacterized protein n=1 Tax=Oikopleura dioica TaxID=34765 RepID=E4Y438_OIKDI|nr:unnamed protein product [Oikopleura dioica]
MRQASQIIESIAANFQSAIPSDDDAPERARSAPANNDDDARKRKRSVDSGASSALGEPRKKRGIISKMFGGLKKQAVVTSPTEAVIQEESTVPLVPGDLGGAEQMTALDRLLRELSPQEKEVIIDEIRSKATSASRSRKSLLQRCPSSKSKSFAANDSRNRS